MLTNFIKCIIWKHYYMNIWLKAYKSCIILINKCGVVDQEVIGPINQNKKTRSPLEVQTSESRRRHWLLRTVVEISMERPPPPPPPPLPQPPKETLARGYKFVWRILLISNLALGGQPTSFVLPFSFWCTHSLFQNTEACVYSIYISISFISYDLCDPFRFR